MYRLSVVVSVVAICLFTVVVGIGPVLVLGAKKLARLDIWSDDACASASGTLYLIEGVCRRGGSTNSQLYLGDAVRFYSSSDCSGPSSHIRAFSTACVNGSSASSTVSYSVAYLTSYTCDTTANMPDGVDVLTRFGYDDAACNANLVEVNYYPYDLCISLGATSSAVFSKSGNTPQYTPYTASTTCEGSQGLTTGVPFTCIVASSPVSSHEIYTVSNYKCKSGALGLYSNNSVSVFHVSVLVTIILALHKMQHVWL
jgi:hypothetical protein